MTFSHVGFSPPMPTLGERVRMALAEVGAVHIPITDDGPDHWFADWALPESDVDTLWRAREVTDPEPLCRRHFDSPHGVARTLCRADRRLILDCGGT